MSKLRKGSSNGSGRFGFGLKASWNRFDESVSAVSYGQNIHRRQKYAIFIGGRNMLIIFTVNGFFRVIKSNALVQNVLMNFLSVSF
jgi:hypothetical protein